MTTIPGTGGAPMPAMLLPPPPHRIDFVALRRHLSAFPGFRSLGRDSVSLVTSVAVGGAALAERSLDLRAALSRQAAWPGAVADSTAAERSAAVAGYAASSSESSKVECLLRSVLDAVPGGGNGLGRVLPPPRGGPERAGVADKRPQSSGEVSPWELAPALENGASERPLSPCDESSKPKSYHAVRVGRSVHSCIFLRWPDAERHVLDFAGAEYESFDDIEEALVFAEGVDGQVGAKKTSNNADGTNRVSREIEDALETTATAEFDPNDLLEDSENSADKEEEEMDLDNAISAVYEKESVKAPVAKKRKLASKTRSGIDKFESKSEDGREAELNDHIHKKLIHEKLRQLEDSEAAGTHLSDSWHTMLERLTSYKEENGSFFIPPEDKQNLDLRFWLARQSAEIRNSRTSRGLYVDYATGDLSPIIAEKARCLKEVGYEPPSSKGDVVRGTTRSPTVSQKWGDMLDRLRVYKERTGSFDIDVDDVGNADLRKWLYREVGHLLRSQTPDGGFVNRQTGQPSPSLGEKARRLTALGYDLRNGKPARKRASAPLSQQWREMYDKMRAFKEETGSVYIKSDDKANASLKQWWNRQVKTIRAEIDNMEASNKSESVEGGGATKLPSGLEEKALLLEELDENVRNRPRSIYHSSRFDEMLERYVRYKAEHDGEELPSVSPDPDISAVIRWVRWQKEEYAKLKDGKESKLSARNIQRLVIAGFDFKPKKEKFKSWAERMEQFRAFKAENGHLMVPSTHPVLGSSVKRKRSEYKAFLEGTLTSNLIENQIRDLMELGFVFETGRKHTPCTDMKSWDERFEDLKAFRSLHGHCVVPKTHLPLGNWVRRQRREYGNIKKGKLSKLTPERVVLLSDIGFVWDATGWGRGGREGFG